MERTFDGVILKAKLEEVKQIQIRPYSTGFSIKDLDFEYSKTFFYGIEFIDPNKIAPNINKSERDSLLLINLRKHVKLFIAKINERRTDVHTMNLRLKVKTSNSLPLEILQEKQNENKNLYNNIHN